MPPLASSIPGFSRPGAPKRTSFIKFPLHCWRMGEGAHHAACRDGRQHTVIASRRRSNQEPRTRPLVCFVASLLVTTVLKIILDTSDLQDSVPRHPAPPRGALEGAQVCGA